MKDDDYSIEKLSEIFSEHARKAEANLKHDIEKYKIMFPDEDLPDHFKNPFNISKALAVMASEICKLKEK